MGQALYVHGGNGEHWHEDKIKSWLEIGGISAVIAEPLENEAE